jgi:hypothetical protein
MWLGIVFLLILKIPIAYVCWVVWWAIKAEPEVGTQGGTEGLSAINWKPWRRPPGSRPPRGGPHGGRARKAARAERAHERTPS